MKSTWVPGWVLIVGALSLLSCNQLFGIHKPSGATDGGHPDIPVTGDGAQSDSKLDTLAVLSDGSPNTDVSTTDDGATVSCAAAGMPCIPTNPCHEGEIACTADGGTTCTDTQRVKSNGETCGDGKVCRAGACEACAADQACPLSGKPCRIGTTVCTSGTSVCSESDNQPDGTGCGTGMVCQAGTCVACMAGEACTPANSCHKGALTCTGGVAQCTDTGTSLAAGAACGKDMVCGAAAACVSCVAGSTCMVAGNPCRTGMTVCNTGAAVCLESGNAPNGTACGTGTVCSGGACVMCTAGLACTPANPCHGGKSVCSPTISCADSADLIQNGTACGTDKVCSAGTCVACAAGKACPFTDPCKAGITSCSTGVSACVASGNSPNGTSCGTGKVCMAGTCVACMAGAACPPTNPCHTGTLACDTGAAVCTDTTMSLPDGTATVCGGTNLVCRSGMCVSCTPNQPCQPTNLCKTGMTSCATGSSVCVETGNKPAGMSCSPVGTTGMVCNAGTCVACTEGGDCKPANACHQGKLSCATGSSTCTDTATLLADGALCGPLPTSNLYCRAGTCMTCTPGLPCTGNPNSCKVGITACTTGVSACIDGANKAAGSACGSSATSACSGADTCDGAGVCNPNHMPALTDCGVCQQCNAAGACVAGYQGAADPTGCNGAASACSAADVCTAGVCQLGNMPALTDCGVCKQCDAAGGCVNGYQGAADPTGCNGAASACSAADVCTAGVCQLGNMPAGNDCGTCKQCDAAGGCINGYQGAADSTGCSTPASCTADAQGNATFTPAAACNAGACVPGVGRACANSLNCATTSACKMVCTGTGSADCVPGTFCSGGTCVPKAGTGGSCATGGAAACASGFCVDGVCCGSACALAASGPGMCMGCSAAATGMPNGTCAPRLGSTTRACPDTNPTICTNTQTDPTNCNACGNTCSTAVPSGTARACLLGMCGANCTAAGNQLCTLQTTGASTCKLMRWGFEPGELTDWGGSVETSFPEVTTLQRHGGTSSITMSPPFNDASIPVDQRLPASIQALPCTTADVGAMDVRGKVFSAWIFVPTPTPASSFVGTSCRLRALTAPPNFTLIPLGTSATRAPITPGVWFQLSGTFPATATQVYEITVDCFLPTDWAFGDENTTHMWFVDDAKIDVTAN